MEIFEMINQLKILGYTICLIHIVGMKNTVERRLSESQLFKLTVNWIAATKEFVY
jgi:biotin synthase-like enzyme